MPKSIRLLSGGAAQGLVKQLQDRFAAEDGFAIRGTFGAVGAMRDKLLGGEPCDLVILSQALIDQLASEGRVVRESITPLGVVKTGIADKAGNAQPDVSSAKALKAALLAAEGVYFPDPDKATAGIHFMKVLKALGIDTGLAPRLRPYPNGAAAMRELAHATESTGVIGCTQVTEILFADGVDLVGLLPPEFALATTYTAAVCTDSKEPAAATDLIRLMAGSQSESVRAACGFERT